MPTLTTDEISELVATQVDQILRQRGGAPFTLDYQDQIDKHEAQLQGMLADRSLGRIINGPTWISGTSVVDGTITAPKISVTNLEAVQTDTGTLNVTGSITAATTFPATGARIVINSSGLWGYSGASTTTFKLNTDGSGEIGTGSNKITWTTSGVLTVPAAVIGSLTIAAVGGGVLGGTYQTTTTGVHINLSTAGIVAYNATSEVSANETFRLDAVTGAMTAIGSFTIKSAATGARVEISNAGGIQTFNSGGTSTFLINAATGSGYAGVSPGILQWDASGNVTVNGTLTIASGGKIVDGDLSEWSQAGIILKSGGSFGDTIKWQVSGTDIGSIYADASSFTARYNGGAGLVFTSTIASFINTSGNASQMTDGNGYMKPYGRFYPGNTAGGQSTAANYITTNTSGRIAFAGVIDLGANTPYVAVTLSGGSGALPNPTKYFPIQDQSTGTVYYIPIFTAVNTWAA